MPVVAVPKQHGVDMAIPEAGEHIHAFRGNDFGVCRHLKCTDCADGGNPFVFDNNYAICQRVTAETVNQTTAHKRKWPPLHGCQKD